MLGQVSPYGVTVRLLIRFFFLGFALLAAWTWLFASCALDLVVYTTALVPVNCAYLGYLLWKHFPVFIPKYSVGILQ